MQAMWAGTLVGLVVFLLLLRRTANPEVSAGLNIGATVLLLPALVAIAAWYGLWKGTVWGWWLALLADFVLLAMFIFSMVDDGLANIDWVMAGVTVTSAIIPVFLLIPVVRRFYWRSQRSPELWS